MYTVITENIIFFVINFWSFLFVCIFITYVTNIIHMYMYVYICYLMLSQFKNLLIQYIDIIKHTPPCRRKTHFLGTASVTPTEKYRYGH